MWEGSMVLDEWLVFLVLFQCVVQLVQCVLGWWCQCQVDLGGNLFSYLLCVEVSGVDVGLKLFVMQFIEVVFDGVYVDLGLIVVLQLFKYYVQWCNQGEVVYVQVLVFQVVYQVVVLGGVVDGYWDDQGVGGFVVGVL